MPEFAFLFNRENVKQYLEKMQKEEKEALQKCKVLRCETCFNDCIPEKCSTCGSGHIFCNDCILYGTECSIADAKYSIKCFKDCVSFFNLNTLEKILTPDLYSTLVRKQQEEELANANIGNLESCPFCDYKLVVNEGDKIFTCMHEDCKKESCRRCKKANHLPYECADVFEAKNARLYLEEKMTKALVRTCYSCKKEFVKETGCNRMSCFCGAVMCYLCDKAVPANDYTHFNGQGSSRFDLCPLYVDDARQEAEAVIEVAKITKRELEKKIPDLNLDLNQLLPILPPKTSGPHEQVPNSNQIPEHARRVAKAIPP
ncbi:E3 ubiquitin-protein ligase RNF216-like [Belonocnema kinseyi]|uniref:E3 ubiquitin-protein ligase RNF216-like n=1 Tax=Belonocnema kinseyi TaxID=2817044 RepID=UPI00143DDCCB|nr:E3 ubiquitin-protein ligase RNF216-like [Belonocnema kinseyi]